MDSETPGFALIACATIFAFVVVGSLLVEAILGRQYRRLDPLDRARMPEAARWWAALWLGVVLVLVAIIQLAMIAALLDPSMAPLTRVIAGLELVLLLAWILAMIRFARGPRSLGDG
jgi:hypothetical protein